MDTCLIAKMVESTSRVSKNDYMVKVNTLKRIIIT